ncbi:hypothetical protein DAI22_07g082601 [Oryza sativa Japonica Group]|nr:hypothetical protein DAI22_07g082601 [Oryza sativa Japonica Group]
MGGRSEYCLVELLEPEGSRDEEKCDECVLRLTTLRVVFDDGGELVATARRPAGCYKFSRSNEPSPSASTAHRSIPRNRRTRTTPIPRKPHPPSSPHLALPQPQIPHQSPIANPHRQSQGRGNNRSQQTPALPPSPKPPREDLRFCWPQPFPQLARYPDDGAVMAQPHKFRVSGAATSQEHNLGRHCTISEANCVLSHVMQCTSVSTI